MNPYKPPSIPEPIKRPEFPIPTPSRPSIGDSAGVRLLLPVGRSGWAIAAGYLGLFGLILVPAPLALIVSIIAIRDIKKKQTHGMGRAVFGLIVGIVGTIALAVIILKAAL